MNPVCGQRFLSAPSLEFSIHGIDVNLGKLSIIGGETHCWERHMVSHPTLLLGPVIVGVLRGGPSVGSLAHSYLDAFPLLVHPKAGHLRATVTPNA